MIRVIRGGLLTTVQDRGRYGYQQLGVSPGGAMDVRQFEFANALVGNPQNAPALEITLMGPTLEFCRTACIALCGADLSASVNDVPLTVGRLYRVPAGSILSFGRPRRGARTYLAVDGGIHVDPVLGSASTHVRGELGGVSGRRLQADDVLELGQPTAMARNWLAAQTWQRHVGEVETVPWRLDSEIAEGVTGTPNNVFDVRLVPGPEAPRLDNHAHQQVVDAVYQVGQAADRMGYRLEGPPALTFAQLPHMWSTGVAWGTVQVPADGMPIVLMAERQTTGGYPRIGVVASVDRSTLAQRRPGDKIRFQWTTVADAQRALLVQRRIDALMLHATGWHPYH